MQAPSTSTNPTSPNVGGNVLPSVKIVSTGAAVGAEVHGVDFSKSVPDDVARALTAAWHTHLVLLIRNQNLSQRQFLDAASLFGEPQVGAAHKYLREGGKLDAKGAELVPEISVLSNLGPDGTPVKENNGLGSLEVVWHSDNSYIEAPPAGSTLYAREIPDDGSGKTSFNNQYLAYEELPGDLRAAISGRSSKQDASRNSAGVLRAGIKKPETPDEVPGPMHPLVRIHPDTGRKALYLGRRRQWPSQFIAGMAHDESETLLDRLWAHATQDKYTWTHSWRVGDMLVWDNRCTMHYREPVNSAQRRVMWRTVFAGDQVIAG